MSFHKTETLGRTKYADPSTINWIHWTWGLLTFLMTNIYIYIWYLHIIYKYFLYTYWNRIIYRIIGQFICTKQSHRATVPNHKLCMPYYTYFTLKWKYLFIFSYIIKYSIYMLVRCKYNILPIKCINIYIRSTCHTPKCNLEIFNKC